MNRVREYGLTKLFHEEERHTLILQLKQLNKLQRAIYQGEVTLSPSRHALLFGSRLLLLTLLRPYARCRSQRVLKPPIDMLISYKPTRRFDVDFVSNVHCTNGDVFCDLLAIKIAVLH